MTENKTGNCLLCGVGGQGTVLASRIIAAAAMDKGVHAKTAETIGMAQRGGSVVSHVRIGEVIASPTIPKGKADVIIGFEPGEAARNIEFLKEGGTLILCEQEVKPVTASLGQSDYDGKTCTEWLCSKVEKCYIVNADEICRECGSPKVLNVAVVGALCASGEMDITIEEVEKAIEKKLKPSFLEMNRKALYMGAETVR